MQWPSFWSTSTSNGSSPSTQTTASGSTKDNSEIQDVVKEETDVNTLDSLINQAKNKATAFIDDISPNPEYAKSSPPAETNPLLSSMFTLPTLLPTILLTTTFLSLFNLHRTYLKRIPTAPQIPPVLLRNPRRSLFGSVTSVGDGDNFRLYHTPGGLLAGWNILPWKRVPTTKTQLKDQTIHVRIAGIDAPEQAHFGRPAQPYSQDALNWLQAYVSKRRVRAFVYRGDQYSRVVGTVWVRKWGGLVRKDVGLEMIRAGWATVYEAKSGSEFGGEEREKLYREVEEWAKKRGKGMWKGWKAGEGWESPRQYKNKYAGGGEDTGKAS